MTPEQRAKDLIDRDWEYFDSGTHSVMYGELEKLITAALREAENAAYEKAAAIAVQNAQNAFLSGSSDGQTIAFTIANAIRALKDKGE